MKRLILILALLAGTAHAQTPEAVAAECMRQMAVGVCAVRPDRASIAIGTTMLLAGAGRVQYSAYLDFMDLYNEAVPSDPAMCDLALLKMHAEPGGDHDRIARALWTPPPGTEQNPQAATDKVLAGMALGATALLASVMLALRRRKV